MLLFLVIEIIIGYFAIRDVTQEQIARFNSNRNRNHRIPSVSSSLASTKFVEEKEWNKNFSIDTRKRY